MNKKWMIFLVFIWLIVTPCRYGEAHAVSHSRGLPASTVPATLRISNTMGANQMVIGQNMSGGSISFLSVLWTFLILLATYIFLRLLSYLLDKLATRFPDFEPAIKRFIPVARILIWLFVFYVIATAIIQPPAAVTIAVVLIIGIALGFASVDVVKNIFGGFMILLDQPFREGDKIAVGDYYGKVRQIGIWSTRLVTPDDSVVSLPNGTVMSEAISNINGMDRGGYPVDVHIYLPVNADVKRAKQLAYKAAVSSKYAYVNKPVDVTVKNDIHEGNFAIKLHIRAYVQDSQYEYSFQDEITEQILAEFNQENFVSG